MTFLKKIMLGGLVIAAANLPAWAGTTQHGIAMHGDLKYGADFQHFDYVNPDAPKGGRMVQSAIGTFDSFNQFIIKGTSADGLGLIYDSLLVRADDEPFSLYGLLAERLEVADDRSWISFKLRPEARFSDGQPVTAEDVAYTFKLLREKGAPFYRAYYADIEQVEVIAPQQVKFHFRGGENRELALIIGEVPILPKHYWQQRDFSAPSLDIPIGSGPYTLSKFDAGRSITYQLRNDYWGTELAANRGRNNFGTIVYDYYLDGTVALEAFKAGEYDFRLENSSKRWATGYTGQPFVEGRIQVRELHHENPTGMQAFAMNIRKPKFSDQRVREALAYAFDFEWTNRNIFYNAYTRSHSYFANSEMAASELPDERELAVLEPIRDQVPDEVFSKVYRAPTTDGNGKIRSHLRTALRLFRQAGWQLKQGKLVNDKGEQFQFELLMRDKAFERIVGPFVRNLELMGIDVQLRLVDISQFINRLRSYDFDMLVASFPQSNSPGNEQRDYWHSTMADQPGSRNIIGIKNPAVDYLVEQLIQAPTRADLVARARALDRVLQWNHYVIPQYHISSYRVAYWDKFGMPAIRPKYSLGLDTWWIKPQQQRSAAN
ncbi:extracellular solute-binding protein [Marinobacterium arenosum]|uniref:extracellular solute-binding protein n=1 Tax=Marinobacterium arenosum TaxID=2862496 RepID=UPI001C96E061|nr:extracellular solute-binding protein [Marinobacterium arenosum]MBY4677252.1 extracellular solute-binding protein [Marinobacterium arenosum]